MLKPPEDLLPYIEDVGARPEEINKNIGQMRTDPNIIFDFESDLADVIRDFKGDPNMEIFLKEFRSLYNSLKDSLDVERRLIKKAEDHAKGTHTTAVKIQSIMRQSQDCFTETQAVKNDIEEICFDMEKCKKKEQEYVQKIESSQQELKALDKTFEDKIALAEVQVQSKLSQLSKSKEELTVQLGLLLADVSDIKNANTGLTSELKQLDDESVRSRMGISELEKKKMDVDKQMQELEAEKTKLDSQIEACKKEIELAHKEKGELSQKVKSGKIQAETIQTMSLEKMKESEHSRDLRHRLEVEVKGLDRERDTQVANFKHVATHVDDQRKEILMKEDEIKGLTKEQSKVFAEKSFLDKKISEVIEERETLTKERDFERANLEIEDEELKKKEKELGDLKEHFEDHMRNKGRMEIGIVKFRQKINGLDDEFMMLKSNEKKMENQVKGFQIELQKLNKQISLLQREQEKSGIEASTAHANYYQKIEELKIKNNIIGDLQRKNAELESKLKHQQNLYEAVRSDRNLYSKNLIEAQQEIGELMRKFTRMRHQILQLKEEIKGKDGALLKEDKNLEGLFKENEETKSKKEIVIEKIKSTESVIAKLDEQISKMKFAIGQSKTLNQKHQKDYEMVVSERDLLGNQLIKRNQELNVLYEKIKISQMNLAKGELRYRELTTELESLKGNLESLKKEYVSNMEQIVCIEDFDKEINILQKELLDEKTKTRALEDEVKTKMNVHRWRKLEATNPENFEKILKVQMLQRRLIGKSDEVQDKGDAIKEKEKLFVELKNILSRQVGAEVYEQVNALKSAIKEKSGHIKSIVQDIKDTREQVNS